MARVLIVDDDPDVVEAITLVLTKEHFEVVSTNSRETGMKAVKASKPDVLILDVMMELPDDGIAMAQDLRRQGFTGPILMLTSLGKVTGFRYDKDESLVPVDAFIEKPVLPAALVSKLNELLTKREG